MADTFYATPVNSQYSPFSDTTITIEDRITPIISNYGTYKTGYHMGLPIAQPVVQHIGLPPLAIPVAQPVNLVSGIGLTTVLRPQGYYYDYDSGIGENPLARHQVNEDLRYRFLDKWLYENYQDILRRLKVSDNKNVKVLSKEDAEQNDISKDSEEILQAKSDFIGYNVLTYSKNMKLLIAMCQKNNIKFYDLPHNHSHVRHEQAKYVKKHLDQMRRD